MYPMWIILFQQKKVTWRAIYMICTCLSAACRCEGRHRRSLVSFAALEWEASSSSPFTAIIHALTWREERNPKDTGRWDPKRSLPVITVATANKCCKKYGTVCATCPNPLTHPKWTFVVLEKCFPRTQGNRGAAATPRTPTWRPYRRFANPWCLLPMGPVLLAPIWTNTCHRSHRSLGLRR